VIQLDSIPAKEFVLGHLCGGIQSKLIDAFTTNETEATTADAAIYEVKLIYNPTANALALDGVTPFSFSAVTKPAINKKVTLEFTMPYQAGVDFFVTGTDGTLEDDGEIVKTVVGANSMVFNLAKAKSKTVVITLVFDKNYSISQKVVLD